MEIKRTQPKKDLPPTPKELQQENLELKLALATLYEQNEADKLELQLALAEVYMMMGGN